MSVTQNDRPTDTRLIKKRLTVDGNFTDAQAEDLVDAFFEADAPVVPRSVLRNEMRRWALRIVGLNLAGTAVLLALFAFVS